MAIIILLRGVSYSSVHWDVSNFNEVIDLITYEMLNDSSWIE